MKTRYEDKIKMALEMQTGNISASGTLKQKIDEKIRGQEKIVSIPLPEKQEVSMKKSAQNKGHFSVKKFVVGVAAACLLLSGGVFAGKTAGYITAGTMGTFSYDELDKAEAKLGFSPDVVENFSNGYSFAEMAVEKTSATDKNGKEIYSFPELYVGYVKGDSKDISLFADQKPEKGEQAKTPDLTDQCGDIALRYDVYTYKFVPVGYELTEEDKANLERDDYEISEGADSVTFSQVTNVTWEKDGTYYVLLGMDTALSGEEMIGMAKEIINAN
ncbi:MAG: hypothetical protein HDQ96_01290 [Lachnospiraceae bacterium]|nr:hypothetical protein [Lachnospiraceae bacterium]